MKNINFLMTAMLLMIATVAQAAEVAGKIGYMNGTLIAQRADGTIKVLGPKSEVFAGDLLVTAKDSYAQVRMNDGAQMTLRPNSNLKIEEYLFKKEEPKADNAIFRLLKGGFRTVTGLIGKRGNADAYKVRASSATIGIRGTDFSSRLCATQDCRDDELAGAGKVVGKQEAPPPQVIGRVMLLQGSLSAKNGDGKERKLVLGAPVYEGDALATGIKSYAVVAFRDESRVSLQESTVFQVEKFKYDKAAAQENAILKLLKGGVRVVTGLIGRINRDSYQFKVANATIGIRGTGFDAWCNGPCASGAGNPGATPGNPLDGAGVYVWAGEVVLVTPGGSFIVAIQQAAIIARDTGKPVPILRVPEKVLDNPVPRPDGVPVDMEKTFGTEANAGDPGLYVTVHEGHVILTQADRTLDLGRGETGFSSEQLLSRLATAPAFLNGDKQLDPSGSGIQEQKDGGIPEGGCKL
ncbi:MAG: hypothetical protein A3F73_03970 [Gallionellales bacterium RIFCSPLOWO2_12_FULL_59_22]|nr:MAG: hypothetical protein A3H99_07850 [Gallionellales bacterium RIFCSPLOWO2_02_FULL_59_110]OGT05172.1 MAG: hypothetical protein A2Z65_07565 [Gallionellales bacterium RIFCSPLOWO2_02_58_13]OGT13611.1 MAG: hypothetical protein A3F73_03970 [Gallionellales bacterium RIFCSPLOWO2_12_FULL_59_22]